jgi:hypothetical protein
MSDKDDLKFEDLFLTADFEKTPGVFSADGVGFCNWGFFEDIVLNTYFGFITEYTTREDNDQFRSKIRSYTTIKDDDGKEKAVQTECRFNSRNLFNQDMDVIMPGRFYHQLTDEKMDELDIGDSVQNKYRETYKLQTAIDNHFTAFKHPTKDKGIIRNFVFKASYLQKHFSQITNLESGLNSFWRSVSSKFGGYWLFDVVQDQSDNGRISVVDKYRTENMIKDNAVYPFTENKSTPRHPEKTFEFNVYSKDSILTEFNVNVSLDSKMVTQAVYHSNKDITMTGNSGMNAPEALGIKALSTMTNATITQDELDEQGKKQKRVDEMLRDITTPYLSGKMSFVNKKGELELKNFINVKQVSTQIENAKELGNRILKEKRIRDGKTWIPEEDEDRKSLLISDSKGVMFKTIKRGMLFYLNKSTPALMEVDPIVPIGITFSLQGIGGIRIGDMFAIDYLPEIYREFSLFQVSKVDHAIGTDGWKTTVEAIMRVNMHGLVKEYGREREREEVELPQVLKATDLGYFIDVQTAEATIKSDTLVWWTDWFVNHGTEILLDGLEEDQYGRNITEIKEIEDELVDIHTFTGTYHIEILREYYNVQKSTEVLDLRKGAQGGNQGPVLNPPMTTGSVMLDYINNLYQKANTLREQTFNTKKGILFIKPETRGISQGASPKYRQAYTQYIITSQGTNGLKNSGLREEVDAGTADDINYILRKRFREVWNKGLHFKWSLS